MGGAEDGGDAAPADAALPLLLPDCGREIVEGMAFGPLWEPPLRPLPPPLSPAPAAKGTETDGDDDESDGGDHESASAGSASGGGGSGSDGGGGRVAAETVVVTLVITAVVEFRNGQTINVQVSPLSDSTKS